MKQVEGSKDPVDQEFIDGLEMRDFHGSDLQLHSLLLATTTHDAYAQVKNIEESTDPWPGLEAWRQLFLDYDPDTSRLGFADMWALLRP